MISLRNVLVVTVVVGTTLYGCSDDTKPTGMAAKSTFSLPQQSVATTQDLANHSAHENAGQSHDKKRAVENTK